MPFVPKAELQKYKELALSEKQHLKKSKTTIMVLGIVALLGIMGTLYFMNSGTSSETIPIKDHQLKVAALENDIQELKNSLKKSNTPNVGPSLNDVPVFAVQVGAFENKNLSLYSKNFVNFKEIKNKEFNAYALGNFESLEEARKFRKEIVELGLKDAFIGSYLNGKRLKIEEVQ